MVKSTKVPLVAVVTALVTNSVVATLVVLSPAVGVGARGVPVKLGLAIGANTVLVYAFVPKVPPVPIFSVEASVPVKVKLLLAVKVLPSAIVSVEPLVGAVIATLFTDVAVATPMVGVVNVGEVANTASPDPVSSLNAVAKSAELVSVFCFPVETELIAALIFPSTFGLLLRCCQLQIRSLLQN